MNENPTCECGHVQDEHDEYGGHCRAEYEGEPCMCVYFEKGDDDE